MMTQNKRDWITAGMIIAGILMITIGYRLMVGLPAW